MAAKKPSPSKKELQQKLDGANIKLKDQKTEIANLKKEVASLKKSSIQFSKGDDAQTITIRGTFDLHHTLYHWASDTKKVKARDLEQLIMDSLQIGIMAKMEGKVSQTLKLFKDEVQSEIALIQSYMETFERNFRKDSDTKTKLEDVVKNQLELYAMKRDYQDSFVNTGADSEKGRAKKGDVVARINDGNGTENLVVEVKFASDYSVGDKRKITEKGLRGENPNVIEQILGSRANRDSEYCIFVVDDELNPLGEQIDVDNPILFLPEVKGFVVQVQVEKGIYLPLFICYEMARSMTLSERPIEFELDMFNFILKNLNETMKRQVSIKDAGSKIIKQLETSHTQNMGAIRTIIVSFERELEATRKAIDRMMGILKDFFETGTMDAKKQREMYLQEIENPIYLAAQNEAKEWTEALSKRYEDQRKVVEIQSQSISDEKKGSDNSKISDSKTAETDYSSMKYAELKTLCKEAGKPVGGKKADLIARLLE